MRPTPHEREVSVRTSATDAPAQREVVTRVIEHCLRGQLLCPQTTRRALRLAAPVGLRM
jgi:hypothetical protein